MSHSLPRHGRIARALRRRLLLLRWGSLYLGANVALALVASLGYLRHYQLPDSGAVLAFVPLMLLSHFTLLTTGLWLATFIPLLVLAPRARYATAIAAAVFAAAAAMLVLDVNVFAENQYHLNGLNVRILAASTWWLTGAIFLLAVAFELMAAHAFVRRGRRPLRHGLLTALVLAACTVAAQVGHIWATVTYYGQVTTLDRFLPVIRPFSAWELLANYHLIDIDLARERAMGEQLGARPDSPMAYPKKVLDCPKDAARLNVAFIVIDTLRADALTPAAMPRTSALAAGMHRFAEHYSGGNKTDFGMFSLFYGLPGSYWTVVRSSHVAPVLVREFLGNGYDIGVFSTHDLYKNHFEQTLFAEVRDIPPVSPATGEHEWQRDAATVSAWETWIERRGPDKPFFGLVMLNALSAYSAPPEAAGLSDGSQPRKTLYLAIAGYMDQLVERAVTSLDRAGHGEDTILVITADHGEEFDESGLGYWGHGKAFTRWQLHVPLLVRWPGREPRQHRERTSHFDIVPTLLGDLFACRNDYRDYSVGKNLFSGRDWPWILASGNQGTAIVAPDLIVTSERGLMEVRDANYHLVDDRTVGADVLSAAIAETSEYYATQ